jgi:hypothetical protein
MHERGAFVCPSSRVAPDMRGPKIPVGHLAWMRLYLPLSLELSQSQAFPSGLRPASLEWDDPTPGNLPWARYALKGSLQIIQREVPITHQHVRRNPSCKILNGAIRYTTSRNSSYQIVAIVQPPSFDTATTVWAVHIRQQIGILARHSSKHSPDAGRIPSLFSWLRHDLLQLSHLLLDHVCIGPGRHVGEAAAQVVQSIFVFTSRCQHDGKELLGVGSKMVRVHA